MREMYQDKLKENSGLFMQIVFTTLTNKYINGFVDGKLKTYKYLYAL